VTVTPRSTQRALGVALCLVAVLAVTGCVSNPPQPERTQSTAPNPSGSNPLNPTPPIDAGATVARIPEAESGSQDAAIEAATAALTAFARPDLRYHEWINGLYPHLTQTGAAAYEDTDPARIPVRKVTGQGVILPASTEVALIVQLPTDAGSYNVSLSRPDAESAWLADRIRPADS
jgi:hypothetical protein